MSDAMKPHKWGLHLPYDTIESSRRAKFITRQSLHQQSHWAVTEKVHGANFSLLTNGTDVLAAKRSSILPEEENFFGWQELRDRYRESVRQLYERLLQDGLLRGETVAVFGELFGGHYAAPGVHHVPNAKAVQSGIQYSPRKEFLAFDVFDGTDYMDVEAANAVLDAVGIPRLEPLLVAEFDTVIKYDPVFESTIPSLFGLPRVDGNFAEGVVIKPVKSLRTRGGKRVILKIKNPKFAESPVGKKAKTPVDQTVTNVLAHLETFITDNRLVSVISKEGPVKRENRGRIAELLYDDAMDDMVKNDEWNATFSALDEGNRNVLVKRGKSLAMKLVYSKPMEES